MTKLPVGVKPIGCKWFFKRKLNHDGCIDKYKYRLVARRIFPKNNWLFWYICTSDQSFSIQIFIASSIQKIFMHQMAVKITLLNDDLEEEIYIVQTEGYNIPWKENKVCKLIKSLYDLKQAPKQWYEKLDQAFI